MVYYPLCSMCFILPISNVHIILSNITISVCTCCIALYAGLVNPLNLYTCTCQYVHDALPSLQYAGLTNLVRTSACSQYMPCLLQNVKIPEVYSPATQSFYHINITRASQPDAKLQCSSLGPSAHLLAIETGVERDYLIQELIPTYGRLYNCFLSKHCLSEYRKKLLQ